MSKKIYVGEIGTLYGVRYLPDYMQTWGKGKIDLYCEVLNQLPKKLAKRFEEFLIGEAKPKSKT